MKLCAALLLLFLSLLFRGVLRASDDAPATTAPTLVTMHLHEATLEAAVNELARQSGLTLHVQPDALLADPETPSVSYDADAQPALLALKAFCEQQSFEPLAAPGAIILQKRDPNATYPPGTMPPSSFAHSPCYTLAWPLLIVATEVAQDNPGSIHPLDRPPHTTTVSLAVIADPRARLFSASPYVMVDEAWDERGNSLVNANSNAPQAQAVSPAQLSSRWDARASFISPPYALGRVTLKGRLHVSLLADEAKLSFDDLGAAAAVEKSVAGVRCRLMPMVKSSDDRDISLTIVRDQQPPEVMVRLEQLVPPANTMLLHIIDSIGQSMPYALSGLVHEKNGDLTIKLRVHLDNPNPAGGLANPPREPAQLIWTVPIEVKELDVPVVLKDIPVP